MSIDDKKTTWLASYPRSGNTWVRFLFGVYANSDVDDWATCTFAIADLHWWIWNSNIASKSKNELICEMDAKFSEMPNSAFRYPNYFCKTHFTWSEMHPLSEITDKVIHLVRHPKDILLSSINFHHLCKEENLPSENEAARNFIDVGGDPAWARIGYGTWFEHFNSWASIDRPRLLVRYEDLKRDTLSEFVRMLEFLGLPIDMQRARLAVQQTTYTEMRRLEVKARNENRFFDAKEGRYFTHRGKSGQSLSEIAADLDELFDAKFSPWLDATGFNSHSQRRAA